MKKTNIPAQQINLIGREKDARALRALLVRDETSLLTITGLGGIGKTSLATQVAGSLQKEFPDGIYFINLVPLTNSENISTEIAHTLHIQSESKTSVLESLETALLKKKILLILDNFEHIMDGASQVNELLQALPQLKIIITSREALLLRAEQVYPLAPLTTDHAIKLFAQRARSVNPNFSLSKEESKAVAELCERLDGLPLAVELAALRTRLFTPQTLLDRLKPDLEPASRMLDLFSTRRRDLPERQQSLRKMIAWSYGLLEKNEQHTLRWASVFPTSFTTQTLAKLMSIPEAQAIEFLISLADKNLLKSSLENSDDTRFSMLESIREFAWDEIRAKDELAEIKKAYLGFYKAWAQEAEEGLRGAEQVNWLIQFDLEYPNLTLALEIGFTAPVNSELWIKGCHILAHIEQYWIIRSYFNEMIQYSNRALAQIEENDFSDKDFLTAKANIYSLVGTCSWVRSNVEAALEKHQQSLALYKELGIEKKVAFALNNIAVNLESTGKAAQAIKSFQQSLALFEQQNDLWGQTQVSFNMSNHYMLVSQEEEKALFFAKQAFECAEKINAPFFLAASSYSMAEIFFKKGAEQEAEKNIQRAVKFSREYQFAQLLGWSLEALIRHEISKGNISLASKYVREGLSLTHGLQQTVIFIRYFQLSARLMYATEKYAKAAQLIGAMDALKEALDNTYNIPDWPGYDDAILSIRARLGKKAYDEKRAIGEKQTQAEIIAFILDKCLPKDNQKTESNPTLGLLTAREKNVLLLLAEGKSNAQIADALTVVVKTAEKHVGNVLSKLQVQNRTEAAAWAIEHGVVKPDIEK